MAERKAAGAYYVLSYQSSASPVTWIPVACTTDKNFKSAVNAVDATSDCGPDSVGGAITQTFGVSGFEDYGNTAIKSGFDLYGLQIAPQNKLSPAYTWKLAPAAPIAGDTQLVFNALISNYTADYATNAPVSFTADMNIQGYAVLTKI